MFERSAEKQEKSQFPALIVDTSNPLPFLSFFFFKDAILTWDLGEKKQTKKKKSILILLLKSQIQTLLKIKRLGHPAQDDD